jgi:hypothetical protein
MEFHLFLPQMRLSFQRLVASARGAEVIGPLAAHGAAAAGEEARR